LENRKFEHYGKNILKNVYILTIQKIDSKSPYQKLILKFRRLDKNPDEFAGVKEQFLIYTTDC